jgi:hypothetical protein
MQGPAALVRRARRPSIGPDRPSAPGLVLYFVDAALLVDPNTIRQLDIPSMEGLPPLDLGPAPELAPLPGLEPPAPQQAP